MDSELQDIENVLKAIRPASPAPASMDRLLAAVEGRLQRTEPGLKPVEERLAGIAPASLSAPLAGAMLATVSRIPFPVDEKVVLFPGGVKTGPAARPRRSWIAAAAAVAVAGAFTAMMVDPAPRSSSGGGSNLASGGTASRTAPKGFVPASVGTGVEQASDEGVMWTRDGKPVRMVRVIYTDKVRYLNEEGEVIEVERPRVEYLMVPEKID